MAELINKLDLLETMALSHRAHINSSRDASLLDRDLRIVLEQPTVTEAEIKAKAILEFVEKVEKRIKEEVALLEQEREEAREYDDEQIIFATNNQLRAFAYSLRVIAEELRSVK